MLMKYFVIAIQFATDNFVIILFCLPQKHPAQGKAGE